MKLAKKTTSTIIVLLFLLQVTLSFINVHHVQAALTDNVTAWTNFSFVPITVGGQPVYDYEGSGDPSNGGTAVQPATADISSCSPNGSLPGTQPSFLVAYYDNATPLNYTDDHIAFRIRLNDDPTEAGGKKGYLSGHWNVLVDIDNDDYKEFVIDLDGSVASQNPDRVYLLYNNANSNTVTGRTGAERAASDTLGGDEIGIWYASGSGTVSGDAYTYNHTRVVTATPSCFGGSEYWLDIQLPLSAFTVSGNQLLTPNTPASFFASTSASIVNPLQKDWMRTPFSFSDEWSPNINATKTDSLFADAAPTGYSPGDTLLYTISITNSGLFTATNVYFHDVPDSNTTLVIGSVTTSQGSITEGNTASDTEVMVNVGSIVSGGSVSITFKVTVVTPLPSGVTQVANHGLVTGDNFTSEPTDDPNTPEDDDPTVTPVTASPLVDAHKSDSLYNDADESGLFSPGDTILYTIVMDNNGNQNAAEVHFDDTPSANLTLVVGSVTTTQGTITKGNTSSDTSVEVNVGTLAGNHSSVTITFKVIIKNPLPAGVTEVCNQGIVSGANFPSEGTDNIGLPGDEDATCTSVTATPKLEAFKHVALTDDLDINGIPSPGDKLSYNVNIINNGNQNATGVIFTDTPPANTTLVAGTVNTSAGTVIKGNTGGDTFVEVSIGTIAGNGGSVTISFDITINSPLPPEVSTLSNQGIVSGSNVPNEPTDDPGTPSDDDPTDIHVTAAPSIHISKTDILSNDVDKNSVASPGDTLTYIITILNNGNTVATNVLFSDTPDLYTTLVANSISTSQGTVTSGNSIPIQVNIGTIGAGQSVQISFQVVIGNNITSVQNSGTITGSNFTQSPSDDPDTPTANDATITAVLIVETTPTPTRRPIEASEAPTIAVTEQWTWCQRPDRICIKYVNVQPQQVLAGQPVTLYANVVNRCDQPDTYTVTLLINGVIEETRNVSVGSSKAVPLQFTITGKEPGQYTLDLNGQQAWFSVVGEKSKSTSSNNTIPIIGFIICAIGVIVVSILLITRRYKAY
ncbi:hypothetical protein ACFLXL_00435 [Chloroflexota bacterium]